MSDKEKKKNHMWYDFICFYKKFKIPWWLFLISLGGGLVYAEVTLKITSYLIMINKGKLFNSVIISYVILNITNSMIAFLRDLFCQYGNELISLRARKTVWNKILHIPVKELEENGPSSLISVVVNDVEQANLVISMIFLSGSSIYGFVRACAKLYSYNATLSVYMMVLIPLTIFVFFLVGRLQYNVMKRQYASLNDMTEYFSEHISSFKHIKVQCMEEKEYFNGAGMIQKRFWADIYMTIMGGIQVFANTFSNVLSTIVLAAGGSSLIRSGKLEKTGINTFDGYMARVNQYLAELLTQYQNIKGTQGALTHVNQIMQIEEENTNAGDEWIDGDNQDIILENVSFGYDNERTIIKNLTCRIPAGKTTAIIGDNGSGKSTVLKLIQGLYQPQGGTITVAGNDLSRTKMKELRSKFGYVMQNNLLFSGSIKDNIIYGTDTNQEDQDYLYYARMAGVDEFIQKFPEGYDSYTEEGGSNLSGGQRQRIAIARTLLSKPKFLLLDEAGASIDRKMYQMIFQSIQKDFADKTIVTVAHDMNEILRADHVIVLKKGKLEAQGSNEYLLKFSETYCNYIEKQQMK